MGRRLRDERGMTAIQVAILFPVVLFWIMLIVQYGLWWHAKQVANAAAAEAVDAAQVSTGTAASTCCSKTSRSRCLPPFATASTVHSIGPVCSGAVIDQLIGTAPPAGMVTVSGGAVASAGDKIGVAVTSIA